MKKSPLYLLVSGPALFITSCGKPPIDMPDAPVPQVVNTPPTVRLVKNISITIPPDCMYLYAPTIDAESNITTVSWKQISGPAQISFSNPDSVETKFSGLVPGNYTIEFTATDKGGLFDKDTTNLVVFALPASTTEIIFQNRVWECNFGCAIFIDLSSLSFTTPFLTYIKRDGTTDWDLVPGVYQCSSTDQYLSFIDNYSNRRNLGIYFNSIGEPDDSPDVKIVY